MPIDLVIGKQQVGWDACKGCGSTEFHVDFHGDIFVDVVCVSCGSSVRFLNLAPNVPQTKSDWSGCCC